MANYATGPGPLTEDGCAVGLYRRLSADDEPEIVESIVPEGATVLEIGAGAGRVTRPLVSKGYRMTAVDSSAEMLAHIAGAETVLGQIETIDSKRTFDAVLLGSCLIHTPDDQQRSAFLRTCRRHLADNGLVLIETHVLARVQVAADGLLDERDGIRCFLKDLSRRGSDATWTQSFSATVFDEGELRQQLQQADLAFGGWIDHRHSWFSAATRTA